MQIRRKNKIALILIGLTAILILSVTLVKADKIGTSRATPVSQASSKIGGGTNVRYDDVSTPEENEDNNSSTGEVFGVVPGYQFNTIYIETDYSGIVSVSGPDWVTTTDEDGSPSARIIGTKSRPKTLYNSHANWANYPRVAFYYTRGANGQPIKHQVDMKLYITDFSKASVNRTIAGGGLYNCNGNYDCYMVEILTSSNNETRNKKIAHAYSNVNTEWQFFEAGTNTPTPAQNFAMLERDIDLMSSVGMPSDKLKELVVPICAKGQSYAENTTNLTDPCYYFVPKHTRTSPFRPGNPLDPAYKANLVTGNTSFQSFERMAIDSIGNQTIIYDTWRPTWNYLSGKESSIQSILDTFPYVYDGAYGRFAGGGTAISAALQALPEQNFQAIFDLNNGTISDIEYSFEFSYHNLTTGTTAGVDHAPIDGIPQNAVFLESPEFVFSFPDVNKSSDLDDTDGDGKVSPGETVTYTIIVGNTGSATANDLEIKDDLSEIDNVFDYNSNTRITIKTTNGVTYTPSSPTIGDLIAGNITADIPAGGKLTITLPLTAKDNIDSSITNVCNTAVVIVPNDGGPDDTIEDEDDCNPVNPGENSVPPIDLEILKDVSDPKGNKDGYASPDEKLTYTLKVLNDRSGGQFDLDNVNGFAEVPATNVKITDNLNDKGLAGMDPSSVRVVSSTRGILSSSEYTNDSTSSRLDITVDTLDLEEQLTITFDATAASNPDPDGNGTIDNISYVTTPDCPDSTPIPSDCDDSDPADIPILNPEDPVIIIEKSSVDDGDGDGLIENGEKFDYTIEVRNESDVDSPNTIISDDIDKYLGDYFTYSNSSNLVITTTGGASYSPNPARIRDLQNENLVADLPAGSTMNITFSVLANDTIQETDPGKRICNTAIATPEDGEPRADDECDDVLPLNPEQPIIDIKKTSSDKSGNNFIENSEDVTYTISVENLTKFATGAQVSDDVVTELAKYYDLTTTEKNRKLVISPSSSSVSPSGATLQDLIDGNVHVDLDPYEKVDFSFTIKAKSTIQETSAGENVCNIVTVNPDDAQAELDDEACNPILPEGEPVIISDKSSSDDNDSGYIENSEDITYTITLENVTDYPTFANVTDDVTQQLGDYYNLSSTVVNQNLNFKNVSGGATISASPSTLSDLINGNVRVDLPAHSKATISFTLPATNSIQDDYAPTTICNIATVEPDNADEQNPEACDPILPEGNASIISKKTSVDDDGDGFIENSEDVTYIIHVENVSSYEDNVTLSDNIISQLSPYYEIDQSDILSIVLTGGATYDPRPATIENLIDGDITLKMPGKSSADIKFKVRAKDNIQDTAPLKICNIAKVKPETSDEQNPETCDPILPENDPVIISDKKSNDANGDGFIEDNEKITYTIVIENISKVETNVQVTDDVISQIAQYYNINSTALNKNLVFIPINGASVITGSTLQDLIDGDVNLKLPGDSRMEISFTLDAISTIEADFGGKIVKNEAIIVPDNEDEQTPDAEDPVLPENTPVIITDKTNVDAGGDGFINNGENVTYTISAENVSDIDSTVTITDDDVLSSPLADYFTITDSVLDQIVTIDPTGLDVSPRNPTLKDLAKGIDIDLPANTKVEVSFYLPATSTIESDFGGSKICNIAEIIKGEDPEAVEEEACLPVLPENPITPIIIADKSINDESGNGFLENSEIVTYTISVENITKFATSATIGDDLISQLSNYYEIDEASEVTFSGNGGAKITSPNHTLVIGDLILGNIILDLPANSSGELTFKLKAKDNVQETSPRTSTCNIATITPADPSQDPLNPDACIPIIPEDAPYIISEKESSDANGNGYIENSEVVTYTIDLENVTSYDSKTFVTDDITEQLGQYYDIDTTVLNRTLVFRSTNGATLAPRSATLQDLIDGNVIVTMPGNSTASISFSVPAIDNIQEKYAPRTITNTAIVEPDDQEPQQPDADDPILPEGIPVITSEKDNIDADADGYIENNEDVTYKIKIENVSAYDETVKVTDNIISQLADYYEIDSDSSLVIELTGGATQEHNPATIADLVAGRLNLTMPARSSAIITFKLKANANIQDAAPLEICNIATVDPTQSHEQTPDACLPVLPENVPIIVSEKESSDANNNGFVENDELVTYKIKVENISQIDTTVQVIDDVIQQLSKYYIIDSEATAQELVFTPTNGASVTKGVTLQDLIDGNISLAMPADSIMEIGFTLKALDTIQEDYAPENILNIATVIPAGDEPQEPEAIDPILPENAPVIITDKVNVDADNSGFISNGEQVKYTISTENRSKVDALVTITDDDVLSGPLTDYFEITETDLNQILEIEPTSLDVNPTNPTLEDLATGISVELPAGSTVKVSFYLTAKKDVQMQYGPSTICNVAEIKEEMADDVIDEEACLPVLPENPQNPIIIADKTSTDANNNGFIEDGEVVTYAIHIENITKFATQSIISDELLTQLANYYEIDETAKVSFSGTRGAVQDPNPATIGDLMNGITVILPGNSSGDLSFSLKAKEGIQTSSAKINLCNVAEIDPQDPTQDLIEPEDCAPILPDDKAIIITDKTSMDANGNGYVEDGEKVTYTIDLENITGTATNVRLTDDVARQLSDYYEFSEQVVSEKLSISPATLEIQPNEATLEDLIEGNVLIKMPAHSKGSVSFELVAKAGIQEEFAPKEICNIAEVAPDGEEIMEPKDCTPIIPEGTPAIIADKTVIDASGDGFLIDGEEATYIIKIDNPTETATNAVVKDDIISQLDKYYKVSENTELTITTINGATYEPANATIADLIKGIDFEMPAKSSASISFSLKANNDNSIAYPKEIICNTAIVLPEEAPEQTPDACIPVYPKEKPIIISEKESSDADLDGYVEDSELVTYTIHVENITKYATTVQVIDDIVEQLSKYYVIDDDVVSQELVFNATNGAEVATGVTLTDLINGDVTLIMPGNSAMDIGFTLKALDTIQEDLAPEKIVNIATVIPEGEDEQNPEADDPILPLDKPVIISEKKSKDANETGYIEDGEEVTYTIKVSNITDIDGENTLVRDDVISQLFKYYNIDDAALAQNLIITPSSAGTGSLADLIEGILVDVPARSSVSISFTLRATETIEEDFGGQIVQNIAIVTPEGEDEQNPDTDDPIFPDNPTEPLVTSKKESVDASGDGFINNNEAVTYTISVSNLTNIPTNAQVNDDVISQLADYYILDSEALSQILSISGGSAYSPSGATLQDLIDGNVNVELGAKESVQISFTLIAISTIEADFGGQIIINKAVIRPDGEDDQEPDTDDPIFPDNPEEPIIISEKSSTDETGDGHIENSEVITYQIVVSNITDIDAKDVMVVDDVIRQLGENFIIDETALSQELIIDPASATSGKTLQNLIEGFTLDVPAKSAVKISFKVKAVDDIQTSGVVTIVNTATIIPDGQDPEYPDDNKPVFPDNPQEPIIGASKTNIDENDNGYVENGEVVTYTVEVENETAIDAINVDVKDNIMAQLSAYFSINTEDLEQELVINPASANVSPSGARLSDLEAGLKVDIPANSKVTFSFDLTAKDDIVANYGGLNILNIAVITAENQDPLEPDADIPIPDEGCDPSDQSDANGCNPDPTPDSDPEPKCDQSAEKSCKTTPDATCDSEAGIDCADAKSGASNNGNVNVPCPDTVPTTASKNANVVSTPSTKVLNTGNRIILFAIGIIIAVVLIVLIRLKANSKY